jgi:hypothetical protein
MDTIPKYNKIEKIPVSFGKIDDYANEKRIQELISEEIRNCLAQYPQIQLLNVFFATSKVSIHLEIEHSYYN